MKLRKTFTIEGRDYSATTLKEAKGMRDDEIRAGFKHLDFGMPKLLLGAGRAILIHCSFGAYGYSFVDLETGILSGGCSFNEFASLREVEAQARTHLAQIDADIAA
jgi:hypothetical protein